MRAVVSLAWARLRHRPARWLLVALGVAAATVLPVSAQATSTVVSGQALRHGLADAAGRRPQPGRGPLRPARVPGRASPPSTHTARDAFAPLAAGPVLVRDAHPVHLGRCRPHLLLRRRGRAGRPGPADRRPAARPAVPRPGARWSRSAPPTPAVSPDLGLVVVGRAVRTDPLLFGGSFDPGDGAPLLLADGVTAAAQLDALSAFQRNYIWVTAVDLDRVDALGVDGYLARSAQASIELYGGPAQPVRPGRGAAGRGRPGPALGPPVRPARRRRDGAAARASPRSARSASAATTRPPSSCCAAAAPPGRRPRC